MAALVVDCADLWGAEGNEPRNHVCAARTNANETRAMQSCRGRRGQEREPNYFFVRDKTPVQARKIQQLLPCSRHEAKEFVHGREKRTSPHNLCRVHRHGAKQYRARQGGGERTSTRINAAGTGQRARQFCARRGGVLGVIRV